MFDDADKSYYLNMTLFLHIVGKFDWGVWYVIIFLYVQF